MSSSSGYPTHISAHRGGAAGLVTLAATMLALSILGTAEATAQSYQFETLYKFQGGTGGATPMAGVRSSDGTIYVATLLGGDASCYPAGCGIIYMLDSSGTWSTVYTFTGTDGAMPFSNLVLDSGGNIYGTTEYGGDFNCSANGCGVVYKLNPTTKQITVLHQFASGSDGIGGSPASVAFDSAGNLYGSADTTGGNGMIFKVDTSGKESVLYPFTGGADGGGSALAIAVDSSGTLYGTTRGGGKYGSGTVFKINTKTGAESALYSFTGGNDGGGPRDARLVQENMVGVTKEGGSGNGVIYEVNVATGDESVLYSFAGGADGSSPGAFDFDAEGNLFGVTHYGGNKACTEGCGTVFKLASGKKTILHNFAGTDGADPGGVLLDPLGNIYGAATGGGNATAACQNMLGMGTTACGTIFELAVSSQTLPATTTTLGASPATVALGGTTTLTAKVTSATAGTIAGTVAFKRGSTALGSAPVSSGKATLSNVAVSTANGFVVGSDTVTAAYGGSTSFASSSGSTTVNITEPTVATPVFSPAAATYESVQLVTIKDSTAGASIHYAINGAVSSTSATYSSPITVSAGEKIEAMAAAPKFNNSATATAVYVIVGSPSALAAPATSIAASSATLNAMVSSGGLSGGTYQFQYATSKSALTSNPVVTSPASLKASSAPEQVQAAITGLKNATTYYFRAVVSTAGGTASGEILTFKTQ